MFDEIAAAGMEDKIRPTQKIRWRFSTATWRTPPVTGLRALVLGLTGGLAEPVPRQGNLKPYYRQTGALFGGPCADDRRYAAFRRRRPEGSPTPVPGAWRTVWYSCIYATAVNQTMARRRLSGRTAPHGRMVPENLPARICRVPCVKPSSTSRFPALRWPLRLWCSPWARRALNGPRRPPGHQSGRQHCRRHTAAPAHTPRRLYTHRQQRLSGRVLNAYRLANETTDMRASLAPSYSRPR